jgi:hypothetical protein
MIDALLSIVIPGAILLALTIDVAMLAGWLLAKKAGKR